MSFVISDKLHVQTWEKFRFVRINALLLSSPLFFLVPHRGDTCPWGNIYTSHNPIINKSIDKFVE